MGPLFGHEIRVIGNHVHKSGLTIFSRIKNIVELEQRCRCSGLDNRGRYNEKVKQGKENDDIYIKEKRMIVESTIQILISKTKQHFQTTLELELGSANARFRTSISGLTHLSHNFFGNFVSWK